MDWLDKFNPHQRNYILFLATGQRDDHNKKMSKEKYAKAHGHDATTLYDWQRLPGFKEAVFYASVSAVAHYFPKMLQAQVDKAIKLGDTQAFMAVMRQSGLLQPDKQENKNEHTGTVQFTNEVPLNADTPST
jgi:hypothetical protein